MKKLYELKESLCDELESYADKGVNSGNIQAIDMLAHAAKNVGKVIEQAEENEYSERGSYNYGGSYGGSYAGGDNRGNMGNRMSNARRRDSRGRYSGEDGYSRTEDMVMELHELMNEAPEHTKGEFRKFIDKIETMR